jgi:hypothetical protein
MYVPYSHPFTHNNNNNDHYCADWAVYEALKTTFIPGYSPYPGFQANSNPPPLDPSIAEIGQENESQVRLAGRYAMCSVTGMSTAAFITNPLEVVRTRWQTSGGRITVSTADGDVTKRATLPALIQQIWRQAGWRGFARGASMRVIYYVGLLRGSVPLAYPYIDLLPTYSLRFRLMCAFSLYAPVQLTELCGQAISMTTFEMLKRNRDKFFG